MYSSPGTPSGTGRRRRPARTPRCWRSGRRSARRRAAGSARTDGGRVTVVLGRAVGVETAAPGAGGDGRATALGDSRLAGRDRPAQAAGRPPGLGQQRAEQARRRAQRSSRRARSAQSPATSVGSAVGRAQHARRTARPAAAEQRQHERVEATGAHCRTHARPRRRRPLATGRRQVRHDRAVRDHDALRPAGRARGVDDVRRRRPARRLRPASVRRRRDRRRTTGSSSASDRRGRRELAGPARSTHQRGAGVGEHEREPLGRVRRVERQVRRAGLRAPRAAPRPVGDRGSATATSVPGPHAARRAGAARAGSRAASSSA